MTMADLSKLKKSKLGTPPSPDEASQNLTAPEVAPAAPQAEPRPRRDGRSARKTHRTLPFATRVSPDFDGRLRDIAERDGLLLVEVLERALDAYETLKESC
jgi:hypothetical protein|tara:strand:- start:4378 stop:4680 length:303 start_codon:yes stop_codon:yes gene_type:complete